MKSLLEVIQGGTQYLEERGVEDARLNMEHLVAKVLGCARLDLYLDFDRPMGEDQLDPLRELLRRRGERVPLQHLLGEVEFYGRIFASDARALIPRPETEELVGLLIKRLGAAPPATVADVGCGSGVIGLSLGAEWPDAELTLIDISADALALAGENAERLGCGNVCFVQGDLLSATDGPFELVVANLPYVATAVVPRLQEEVGYDPHQALVGGETGTELIARLIRGLPERLAKGGTVALEIGEGQANELVEIARSAGFGGGGERERPRRRRTFYSGVALSSTRDSRPHGKAPRPRRFPFEGNRYRQRF